MEVGVDPQPLTDRRGRAGGEGRVGLSGRGPTLPRAGVLAGYRVGSCRVDTGREGGPVVTAAHEDMPGTIVALFGLTGELVTGQPRPVEQVRRDGGILGPDEQPLAGAEIPHAAGQEEEQPAAAVHPAAVEVCLGLRRQLVSRVSSQGRLSRGSAAGQ